MRNLKLNLKTGKIHSEIILNYISKNRSEEKTFTNENKENRILIIK